jgi:hypothetical protein
MPKLGTVYINVCVFSPIIHVDDDEVDDADVELHCRVEEQKESVDGLKDEVCGRIVEKGHAGLCE